MDVHNNNTQSTDQKTELENITRKKQEQLEAYWKVLKNWAVDVVQTVWGQNPVRAFCYSVMIISN
jgi:hypothetical protein